MVANYRAENIEIMFKCKDQWTCIMKIDYIYIAWLIECDIPTISWPSDSLLEAFITFIFISR